MDNKEMIQQIRDCGQSIIDKAESIYGHYTFDCGQLIIQITIDKNAIPVIEARKQFIPEEFFKRIKI